MKILIDMETVILYATFVFGCITALTSLGLLIFFARTRKRLGFAMAFMLFGEFVAMTITALFAWFELRDMFPDITTLEASAMRFIMFFVTMASSVHLSFQVHHTLKHFNNE